jgi:hypothetical protein
MTTDSAKRLKPIPTSGEATSDELPTEMSRGPAARVRTRWISWRRAAQTPVTSESSLQDAVAAGEYPATAPKTEFPFSMQNLMKIVATCRRRSQMHDDLPTGLKTQGLARKVW